MIDHAAQAKRSRVAVVVVVLAVFMTNLDLWIVNIALPTMASSFGSGGRPASLSELSWVLNAYAITLAALLVVIGRIGDRIGHRPVFLAGLFVFTIGSAACAVAPQLWVLVLARVVQASGAAAQLPTSLALLLAAVPAERRTSAARSWGAVGGLAAAAGPVLGGLLVQVNWRWVFVVNLPIGIIALVAGLVVLPRTRATEMGRLPDIGGAVLTIAAMAALSGGLVEAPTWGWGSARVIGLFIVAVVAGSWFCLRTRRHPSPLVEPGLLRLPQFGEASVGTFVFGVAFAILLLSNVLWCQDIWHWSALRTGLALLPGPALVPIVTILTARLVRQVGHGPLVLVGGVVFALAFVWRILFVSITPDYVHDLMPCMILAGIGVGLALGTLIAGGVQALPADRAATGSAVANALRQVSASVGVAILVSIIGGKVDAGLVDDFKAGWAVGTGLGILTAVVGALLIRSSGKQRVPDGQDLHANAG